MHLKGDADVRLKASLPRFGEAHKETLLHQLREITLTSWNTVRAFKVKSTYIFGGRPVHHNVYGEFPHASSEIFAANRVVAKVSKQTTYLQQVYPELLSENNALTSAQVEAPPGSGESSAG